MEAGDHRRQGRQPLHQVEKERRKLKMLKTYQAKQLESQIRIAAVLGNLRLEL